jgi:hypothetical protein
MICQKKVRDALLESVVSILGEPRFRSPCSGTYVMDIVDGQYEPRLNSKGKKRLEYEHNFEWSKNDMYFDVTFCSDTEISVTIYSYKKGQDEIRCYDDVNVAQILMLASDFLFEKIKLISNSKNEGIPLIRTTTYGELDE